MTAARRGAVEDARRILDGIAERIAASDRERAAIEVDLADAIRAARAAGIRGVEIERRTGVSRAWLYRRYRNEMTS